MISAGACGVAERTAARSRCHCADRRIEEERMNQRLYEPCLCGSGKKMKFCCADLIADWEKILRLIDADQPIGALEHLNRVIDQRKRQGKPDNPALLAERIYLMRITDRDQWRDEADRFIASCPDNPRAILWQGIKILDPGNGPDGLAIEPSEEDLRAAMDRWLTARESCTAPPQEWMTLAFDLVETMISHGWFRPAVLILMVVTFGENAPDWAKRYRVSLQTDTTIPLALRCFENLGVWPKVQQSPLLNECWSKLIAFDWRRAERQLTELTGTNDAPAAAWRLLAETRLLLGKTEEARDALRAYIAKWPSSADVFEAELLLLSLGSKRERGWISVNRRRWKVLDIDRVQEAIISDSRCAVLDRSVTEKLDTEVRPRIVCELYPAGPLPNDAEVISAEQVPVGLGKLMLFGKQTDRDAELAISAIGEGIDSAVALVREICGDLISEMSVEESEVTYSWLWSEIIRTPRWPEHIEQKRIVELEKSRTRELIVRRWPSRPVECLGGRTFFEAAADPSLRMRLLALIDLEERLLMMPELQPFFDELRSELGVRTPMEDGRSSTDHFFFVLSRYLDSDSLSDRDLLVMLGMAETYRDDLSFIHAGSALLRRESFRNQEITPFICYNLARFLGNRDEAEEWIEFGRRFTAEGKPNLPEWEWMLLEARWHLRRGDIKRAFNMVFERINSRWTGREEFETFVERAFSFGLIPPEIIEKAAMQTESPAAEEPAGLWTPESAAPAAGGGKLWVPE